MDFSSLPFRTILPMTEKNTKNFGLPMMYQDTFGISQNQEWKN